MHPIFDRFERWRGPSVVGSDVDFLGVRTSHDFRTGTPLRFEGEIEPSLPNIDEEYFEWVDLLESVDGARGLFTMVELGAGWGRWLAIAAAAARQRALPFVLVGVEAEPTHFRWMVEHFAANDIGPDALRLHEAAVAKADGTVLFRVGDAAASYGQAIVEPPPRPRSLVAHAKARIWPLDLPPVRSVPALSLGTILGDLERVDLVDLDVQGSEADVLEAGAVELETKVQRVHIGTHSEDNERRCRVLFEKLGWVAVNDYPSGERVATPYGEISFQDGVQTWTNPGL
jgi:FkbM family methyltransferase